MLDPHALKIYTDGSCYSIPHRVGGFGFAIEYPDHLGKETKEVSGNSYKGSSISEMELRCCVDALKYVFFNEDRNLFTRIQICSDSSYVIHGYKSAVNFWSKNGWLKKDGNPVEYEELWKDLIREIKRIQKRVDFEKVKAHSGNTNNDKADKMAKRSARSNVKAVNNNQNKNKIVRFKDFNKFKFVKGSVKMLGQRLRVKIIISSYYKNHNLFKYRFQIISKKSKFFGFVDEIYSKEVLRPNHYYLVILGKDNSRPTFSKVIREIERTNLK